jgi:sugar/nucleoside kinase (ribokinase family)
MTGLQPPEYVAIGHLAVDRTPDGERLGGSVLYGAMTAAKLGARVGVMTRGNLEKLSPRVRTELELLADHMELVIEASDDCTTFTNAEVAGRRQQTLHGWAGPIDLSGMPAHWRSASVIHLAPIAQDFDPRQAAKVSPGFLGATPQGWMRTWHETDFGVVIRVPPRLPNELTMRLNALVVSANEYTLARELYELVGRNALAVMTRGRQGARALDRGRQVEVPAFQVREVDTTGAGDVFAAVLFLMRARGESTNASLRHASAASAISVGRVGVSNVPSFPEIEDLVNDPRPLT